MTKTPVDPGDLPHGYSLTPLMAKEEIPGHGRTPEEVGELTMKIATNADMHRLAPEPDRKNAWIEDVGGGQSTHPPQGAIAGLDPVKSEFKLHRTGNVRDLESDRDHIDETAGEPTGPPLPPEQHDRVYRDGGKLWREVLLRHTEQQPQERQATPEQTERVEPWIAPAHVGRDMGTLGTDTRAGFWPSTEGERTAAVRLLRYMRLDRKRPDTVDAYLTRQRGFIKKSGLDKKMSDAAAQAAADQAVHEEIAKYGSYARQHAEKASDVRVLYDFMQDRDGTERLSELLAKLPDAGSGTIKRGILALVEHVALREVTRYGRSSAGVNVFRNIGLNFDKIAAQLGTEAANKYSNRALVLKYVQEQLDVMTVADAKGMTAPSPYKSVSGFHNKGKEFWKRVLGSIKGDFKDVAEEVLNSIPVDES